MRKLILLIALLIPLISLAQGSREVSGAKTITDSKLYKRSFLDDGGDFQDHPYHIADGLTKAYYRMAYLNDMRESIELAYLGEAADKVREDGIYDYITDVYDLGLTNDGSQTTESSQPYKTGNIAPSERVGMLNPSGDSRYMDITPLTVSGTWTITKAELTDTGRVLITHTELTSGTISTITPNNAIYAYIVRSEQLTDAQKTAEADFLQSIYPPIPTVKIGDQEWATSNFDAVATCQGNVIANVTENANVEKITNVDDREFNSDTGNWAKGTGWTISGGSASHADIGDSFLALTGSVIVGKMYKVSANITHSSGVYQLSVGNDIGAARNSGGDIVEYFIATSTDNIKCFAAAFVGDINSISMEEVGWAGSQELYDGLIAQGESVYEATKAAAMWCYYNNDSQLGAVYGKLYNWFAVSLIQQDIDLYNAANEVDWGYHVPSSTEFTTLQTTLGGSAVAGGKMKFEGFDYWNSPNTGATNSSGLSALGAGRRTTSFDNLGNYIFLWSITGSGSNANRLFLRYDQEACEILIPDAKTQGHQLRLIKDE